MAKLTKIQIDLLKRFVDKFELNIKSNGEELSFEDAVSIIQGETPSKLTIQQKKEYFISMLRPYVSTYGSDMLNKFYRYWVQQVGNKLKYETQSTFDIKLRLANWKKNDEEFERQKYINNLKNRL